MNNKDKQVALYARVSTDTGKQNPEMQLVQLRQYCKQRGFTIYKEYVDHMSGSRDDRPNFQAMMDDCRKRKVDIVLVWKFDRFARSTKSLINALDEFRQLNIDFISYTENWDTQNAVGKILFTIVACISEFEKSLIQQRISTSLKVLKDNGVQLGRPRKGIDIGKALKLKQEGLGLRRIGKQLGVSHATINRYLQAVTKTHPTKVA